MSGAARRTPGHLSDCFGCGPRNPHALGIVITADGDEAVAEVTFRPEFIGYRDLVHGGALATAFDEVAGSVPELIAEARVTKSLAVRYRKPVALNRPVRLRAGIVERAGTERRVRATLTYRDDEVVRAEADACVVLLGDVRTATLLRG
jgi:acyl-coenzyme A thioesterase PaaI-like protein